MPSISKSCVEMACKTLAHPNEYRNNAQMNKKHILAAVMLLLAGALSSMSAEEPKYEVVKEDGDIEIRDYEPQIVAETLVKGDLEEAASKAFNKLFGYISGENQAKSKIAMTAPVSQESTGEKIAMTAPVSQSQKGTNNQFAVRFTMPASFTMETIPDPKDEAVNIRLIPARRVAAIRYSGRWTEKNYIQHKKILEKWVKKKGLKPVGETVWARYDPPFTLWFMRRNEVLIPIEKQEE